jgi:hypothetical protein
MIHCLAHTSAPSRSSRRSAPAAGRGLPRAYQEADRDVAIKVLLQSVAADLDTFTRFEREAKAVVALSHPNIVSIFDFGAEAGIDTSMELPASIGPSSSRGPNAARMWHLFDLNQTVRQFALLRTDKAVAIAVVACAAYYVGSWIGLRLRLPPAVVRDTTMLVFGEASMP